MRHAAGPTRLTTRGTNAYLATQYRAESIDLSLQLSRVEKGEYILIVHVPESDLIIEELTTEQV